MFLFIYFDFDPLTEVVMDRVSYFEVGLLGIICWTWGSNRSGLGNFMD